MRLRLRADFLNCVSKLDLASQGLRLRVDFELLVPVFLFPSHKSSSVFFGSSVLFRLYSSRGNCGKVLFLRRGLGELDPKVGKNSNYDYFKLSIFLI